MTNAVLLWTLVPHVLLQCVSGLTLADVLGKERKPTVHVRAFHTPVSLLAGKKGLASLDTINLNTEGGVFGQPVCTGSAEFIADPTDAPPDFCRHLNAQQNMTLALSVPGKKVDFDEFSLERIMLGRWQQVEQRRCKSRKGQRCENADIVVVPSLGFQNLLTHGYKWPAASGAIPKAIREYWTSLREELYHPDKQYTPIVVVHQPYTFVKDQSVDMLRALLEQPAGFVNRVVVGAIESNMRPGVRQKIGMPEAWQDSAHMELARRKSIDYDSTKGSPLIVSLPYPTPILRPTSFLVDQGDFVSAKPRRIAVLLSASLQKGQGSNWIRPLLHKELGRASGAENGVVCAVDASNKNGADFCGLPKPRRTLWDTLVNSAFCIEPAGDTLTRSHFYLAVLSGCIPVLFDGGHTLYEDSRHTAWAWRKHASVSSNSDSFVDFNQFAVIYNSSDVKSKKVDIVKELREMPDKQPLRFLALRQGLEQVAPLMRYAGNDCGATCEDAFTFFESMVYKMP